MPTTETLSVNGHVVWAGSRLEAARRLPTIARMQKRSPTLRELFARLGLAWTCGAMINETWDSIRRTVCTPDAVLCEEYDVIDGEIMGHRRLFHSSGGFP